jgi:hypothetical protein
MNWSQKERDKEKVVGSKMMGTAYFAQSTVVEQ